MFAKRKSSEGYHSNEQCCCHDENISYKIIENYRSILDRTQLFRSTWKIFERDAKIHFTSGTYQRKGTDALVLRLNQICLINPWYKYVNVNQHLLAIVKHSQAYQVFEIVLLECSCLKSLNEYELAIVQCPCLEQRKSHCSYCRFLLVATEQSKQVLKNVKQQMNNSCSSNFSDEEGMIYDRFHYQSGRHHNQHAIEIQRKSHSMSNTIDQSMKGSVNSLYTPSTSQTFHNPVCETSSIVSDIQVSIPLSHDGDDLRSSLSFDEDVTLNENAHREYTNHRTRQTQTKLCAILLPQSLLNEMKRAKTTRRTSTTITRSCQVNTLSYLIKINENPMDLSQVNVSSSASFLYSKFQFNEQLSTEENDNHIKLSRKIKHQPLIHRHYEDSVVHIPIIQIEEDGISGIFQEDQTKSSLFTLAPLKCINACESVDLDEPNTSITSIPIIHDAIDLINTNQPSINYSTATVISLNNNCENVSFEHIPSISCKPSKLHSTRNKYYRILFRKRRRHQNRRRIHGFLRRLSRRKKTGVIALDPSNPDNQLEIHPPSIECKTNISSNRKQQSTIDLHLNISDTISQFKSIDHTIIARATKNSPVCKQLQTLLNNHDTLLEQLIETQLTFTCHHHCKSLCILLDNHKQSDQHRSSFLHYIYTSLSNTLKNLIRQPSVQITCMNLAFFNNAVCDIINMRRLRLIDTGRKQLILDVIPRGFFLGRKTILLPSCEIPLRTLGDINTAINRLSTKMSFAHQIFIINFSHECSSSTSSYFFLQLAPICSIRPTGLLTNLNSSTYSVLNLIRQFNTGQLFHHNTTKRYLMNDCSLNRLLKSYLLSPQQTMTVITVKPQEQIKTNGI